MRSYLRDAMLAKQAKGDDAGSDVLLEGAQYYTSLIQNAINCHKVSDAPLILFALETCARSMRQHLNPSARRTAAAIVKDLHELLDAAVVTVDLSELATKAERKEGSHDD